MATFLDWEKAFDKLDHAKMFVTLSRLRMPENLIEIIKSCPSINSHNPSPSFDSVQFSSLFFTQLILDSVLVMDHGIHSGMGCTLYCNKGRQLASTHRHLVRRMVYERQSWRHGSWLDLDCC